MFCISYVITAFAVDNGRQTPTVLGARRGTENGEGNFLGFQGMHCGVFIKL